MSGSVFLSVSLSSSLVIQHKRVSLCLCTRTAFLNLCKLPTLHTFYFSLCFLGAELSVLFCDLSTTAIIGE